MLVDETYTNKDVPIPANYNYMNLDQYSDIAITDSRLQV